jgi:GR25 family glycosyltransferase involved in LPS biosynthesis
MIDQKDIPTFIINLKRRPDRLDLIKKEMNYMGWQYQIFNAIDTNSYIGCGKSHTAIAEIAYKNNFEHVMVLEDDACAMPYSKELWNLCLIELDAIEWSMLNITPTLHRKVNNISNYLLDITNLPYEETLHSQEKIFGATGLFYKKTVFEKILEWEQTTPDHAMPLAFDDYLARYVYPYVPSFAPAYPLFTQFPGLSDINNQMYDPHYIITYNWNLYTDNKLQPHMQNINLINEFKKNNLYQSVFDGAWV